MKCPKCGYELEDGDTVLVSAEVRALVDGSGVYEDGELEYDLDELVQVTEVIELEFKCPKCEEWSSSREWG